LRRSLQRNGQEPVITGASWFSDAGPLSKVCDNLAVFGPGSIAQAHTSEEYIELPALQAGYDVLKGLIEETARDWRNGE